VTSPLLETKFYAPRQRSGRVPRPRLTERLGRGTQSKLTLVSAPAGFGKSTLVAEWLAAAPAAGSVAAWLSLDPSDNHPMVFWAHVIVALQKVEPAVGASALSLLEAPGPSIETVLAPLLNDLDLVANDIVLVLDDYHTIDAPEIQVGITFMLEHLPANVHLVITTRADPVLPLARLRARGELVEVRAADLRFTPDEATAYLNGVMTLELTAGDVAKLEERTEGWIAALQLAGLSMQGRDDHAAFIAGFAGDDRYIVDYLVEEVWQRQPDHIRDFLLQTSILARMTGPLCDAVTGQAGGKATLEGLDRRNLFLIPLDDQRRWYRYHHLFGDVLQTRLLDEQPEVVAALHRRAAEWYAQEGEPDEAIRHAIAGGNFGRAADLIELVIPAMGRDRREATVRRWLDAIPDEVVRARPVLSDGYAASLLVRGETDGVAGRLADAERWLQLTAESLASHGPRPPEMVVADEVAFRSLPASIAIHRAGLARILGDDAATVAHAQRALDLVGEDEHLGRGGAAALMGLAYWAVGELDAAQRCYVDAMASLDKAGHLSDEIGLALGLADMQIAQGRLHDAMRTYERGLKLATSQGGRVLRGAADMHVGISEILRQRDDLAGAAHHLQSASELGDENGLPQNPYRSRVAAARIRQADGDFEAALELLAEADRLYANDFSPDVRPVGALRARVWITQGRVSEALNWARECDLSAADDLRYVREFEHITLARLLLAQGVLERNEKSLGDAIGLLERLLVAAEDGGRTGSVIEILVAQALARRAHDDAPGALGSLERAVKLAEPEGYVRVIADEGPPMVGLLRVATEQPHASDYLRRLLAATVMPAALAPADQSLVEPLSEREVEVLRLLGGDLDGPDIARELTVSLPTVRTHTSNIYAKLGVTSRRAAVRRAIELGLLSHGDGRRPTV
jgi:LuxR family maltose regulon positive regulatory protein